MKIVGFQKNSFVDYPGKIAAVVFTPGCNMNCSYCHNRSILKDNGNVESINNYDIINFLKSRNKFLDGVVVSGGEPTLQDGLTEFIQEIKELGYAVKLDTNGTNPKLLKYLIKNKMIDYIAMDMKAPFNKYSNICGVNVEIKNIKESINILKESNIEYEFRTTFAPGLENEDILKIAEDINGAQRYVVQKFRSPIGVDLVSDVKESLKNQSISTLSPLMQQIKSQVERLDFRGFGQIS